ncbi:MAG: hypothetical protein H7331_02225 [Bacteroidia bacterium]|nr:hypothetical protein [Bacteroidia bacterium]
MSLIIKSTIENSNATAQQLFEHCLNMNNLEGCMPPQVSQWLSTADSCSYNLNGMATIAMKVASSTAPNTIVTQSEGDKNPFIFTLTFNICAVTDATCTLQLVFDGEVNMFMKPMIEKPLTNFFNYLTAQLAKNAVAAA